MIIGMHRSGTSAVSNVVHELINFAPPEAMRLARGDIFNPHGYWEPEQLVNLNDRILASWGAHWADPRASSYPPTLEVIEESLRNEMLTFASRWTSETSYCIWKDPRLSLTFPLWAHCFADLRVVWCIRDPEAVARSLEARDSIPIRFGLSIWETYNRFIASHITRFPFLIVDYEDLIMDSERVVHEFVEFLSPLVPGASCRVPNALRAIAPSAQHHRLSPVDAKAPSHPTHRTLFDHIKAKRIEGLGSQYSSIPPEVHSELLALFVQTMHRLRVVEWERDSWKHDYFRLSRIPPLRFLRWVRRIFWTQGSSPQALRPPGTSADSARGSGP